MPIELQGEGRSAAVGIFCGSSLGDERMADAFRLVTDALASVGMTLVYGGGGAGLMGVAARSFQERACRVLAFSAPQVIDREPASSGVETTMLPGVKERIDIIISHSDVLLVGPGGLGTLEEFSVAASGRQLSGHDKPVVLFNPYGYWNGLLHQLRLAETLFGYVDVLRAFEVANDPETAVQVLTEKAQNGAQFR